MSIKIRKTFRSRRYITLPPSIPELFVPVLFQLDLPPRNFLFPFILNPIQDVFKLIEFNGTTLVKIHIPSHLSGFLIPSVGRPFLHLSCGSGTKSIKVAFPTGSLEGCKGSFRSGVKKILIVTG